MEPFGSTTTFLGQSDCTARSMVKALDNFLKSVQKMKDTIMVPSRLKDIKATLSDEDVSPPAYNDDLWSVIPTSYRSSRHPQLCLSLFGAKSSTGSSDIDLYSFYTMLRSIRNELVCGSPRLSANEKAKTSTTGGCCKNRHQLTSLDSQYGSMTSSEEDQASCSSSSVGSLSPDDTKDDDDGDNEERTDEHAEHLAAIFRQHLTGLFVVLRQMTEAAHYCSLKYQDEIESKK